MPNPKPFLSFYGEHDIIPVAQNITTNHLNRRFYLYRTLGLLGTRSISEQLRIAEIGPGTGDNAVVTAKIFKNASFTYIDGNPKSLESIRAKISKKHLPHDSIVVEADFASDDQSLVELQNTFDLVLCEGCIPGQADPLYFAKKIFRLANHGTIVMTCADIYSTLPEILRRLYRPFLIRNSFAESVAVGEAVFASHLAALPSMSRKPSEWVMDQVLHPWTHQNWQFSILDAIDVVQSHGYNYLGSSPSFYNDWSWYKQVSDCGSYWNDRARRQWWQQRIFSMDMRLTPEHVEIPSINELDMALQSLNKFAAKVTTNDSHVYTSSDEEELLIYLNKICESLRTSSSPGLLEPMLRSLADFINAWPSLCRGNIECDTKSFNSWWGRGQQYISFQMNPSFLAANL